VQASACNRGRRLVVLLGVVVLVDAGVSLAVYSLLSLRGPDLSIAPDSRCLTRNGRRLTHTVPVGVAPCVNRYIPLAHRADSGEMKKGPGLYQETSDVTLSLGRGW
jgi:hypothetical protein